VPQRLQAPEPIIGEDLKLTNDPVEPETIDLTPVYEEEKEPAERTNREYTARESKHDLDLSNGLNTDLDGVINN